jgi:alpha-tubulin suppressor-like RCC1 family protein
MSWDHACAVTGGGVICWGNNDLGAVGLGAPLHAPPTAVPDLDHVQEVATLQLASCALRDDGTTWCWGNPFGVQAPTRVGALPLAVRVVGGSATVCAITREGAVACAGKALTCSSTGATSTFAPVDVPTLANVTDLALGSSHACALLADGGVWCWGCGDSGAIGDLSVPESRSPVRVPIAPAQRLASETRATCAIVGDGITCWGDGSQFGTSLTVNPVSPQYVAFGGHDVDVGVVSMCAARDADVTCTGSMYDSDARCGNRSVQLRRFPLPSVREVSIGYQDMCARDAGGAVWCWGCNLTGGVGDPTLAGHSQPWKVPL